MKIEVYINGNKAELNEPLAFSLTRQINDFGELRDRQATYTNSFVLPMTKNNVQIFNGLGIFGIQTRKQYEKLNVNIILDSVQVVKNGFGIITETDKDYKLTVYDDNIHLFEKLGSKTINELSLSNLTHELTTTNFVNSFANTYLNGYIYAISDFGNFNPNEIIINNQLPSIFIAYIWNKIFTEAGFTKDFTPDLDLLMTPKRGYDTVIDGYATEINVIGEFMELNSIQNEEAERNVFLELHPNQTTGQIRNENGYITVMSDNTYYYEVTTTIIDSVGWLNIDIKVKINGIVSVIHDTGDNYSSTVTGQLPLNIGDVVSFEYYILLDGAPSENENALVIADVGVKFYKELGSTGLQVNLQLFIGEIKQVDFIKDIMQHYGLLSKKSKDENHISFIKAKDLLQNKSNAIDVTGKLILESETYGTGYAQKNNFKYLYKNTDEIPFADGAMIIDNKTLPAEKTEVTRLYQAPTTSSLLLLDEILRYTPFWEAERDNNGVVTKWKVLKGKSYIGKKENRTGTINYKTTTSSVETYTGEYPVFLFPQLLTYQSILTENYTEINNMLNWNRNIKGKIKMNLFEFDSFDFFTLLFSNGVYYYVNSLKLTNGKPYIDVELTQIQ
jgi:hypothetical protein